MKIYEKLMRKLRKMFGKRKFKGFKIGSKVRIEWYVFHDEEPLITTMEVMHDGTYVWLENRLMRRVAYRSFRFTHMAELVEAIADDIEDGAILRYEIVG
ncbi:hypothetical protein [Bacillus thuringiensis]|uniref:hypothetical protein n=1 Tax=Bacillus thuringiensis TaxID=1428 RepID=UPI000BEDF176|nr:hypothetical protein [Bacillus thuringiensis]PEE69357.1 hypothetical protein COM73_18910 [Bacillus thuringiensis]PET15035.1 hypothetical protein CN517_26045 [Bacillus thuringiensis]